MINIKYNKKRNKFLQINIGDTFVYDDCIYIRIPYIKNEITGAELNALNLTNNNLAWVYDDIVVDIVDLDITVKGA